MQSNSDNSHDEDDLDDGAGDWPQKPDYRGVTRAILGLVLVIVVGIGGYFAWRTLVPVDHRARAHQFLAAKDYESAIVELKLAIQHDPLDAEMRWLVGYAYLQLGKPSYAADYLEVAYRRGYHDPQMLLALARARLMLSEYEAALQLYREWSIVGSGTDAAAWEAIRRESLVKTGR